VGRVEIPEITELVVASDHGAGDRPYYPPEMG
jgi:hypothetical protein